jgi:magnesium transporter
MTATANGRRRNWVRRREQKCGVDPASASAPFVATLVDVTGLIIYFSVAKIILTGTLL